MKSSQSQWATTWLNNHTQLLACDPDWTLLFEIIYPDNRIIVNYADREELVLLAIRNRQTGAYLPNEKVDELAKLWNLSRPKYFSFNSVSDILEAAARIDFDQEGWIVEFSDGSRWKFKGNRYRELHRLITGLSYRKIVEAMASDTLEQMLEVIPEEFLVEARAWATDITRKVEAIEAQCYETMKLAPEGDQKMFAQWVMANHYSISSYLFKLRKGDEIRSLIYQREFD